MVINIDHVALEVGDFDERVAWMTEHLGLELRRIGRLTSDHGRRIAMLADARGVKLELIEAPASGTATGTADAVTHVAFAVEDVAATEASLVDAGAEVVRPTARFEPAHSWTATVRPPLGVDVQLVRYDPGSPDA